MFGADRVPILPARVIRLTFAVESKSQNAASASMSMRTIEKNGSKKNVGIRFQGGSFFS
jgi:hypothetical protein